AEINPAMPRTHGESFVHVNQFDALVRVDSPIAEYVHPKIGEVAERVARYIASIIDDGSPCRSVWAGSQMRRYVISEIGATSASIATSSLMASRTSSRPAS